MTHGRRVVLVPKQRREGEVAVTHGRRVVLAPKQRREQ